MTFSDPRFSTETNQEIQQIDEQIAQEKEQAAIAEQPIAEASTQAPQQPKAEQPSTEGEQQQGPNVGAAGGGDRSDQLIPQMMDGTADVGDYLRFGREQGAAPVAGAVDFGVGMFNYVMPGEKLDIKQEWYQKGPLAPFNNDTATALRKMSEVAIGEYILYRLGMRGLKGAGGMAAAGKLGPASKALNTIKGSAFGKWVGRIGVAGTAGVVATDASTSAEEDNALGTLKQMWPETAGTAIKFLGVDGLASGEGMSPDEKRDLNRLESLYFLGVGEVIGTAAKLVKNSRGVRSFTQWMKGKSKVDRADLNAPEVTGDPAVDNLVNRINQQNKDLDDYGTWQMSKLNEDEWFDKPTKGIHDMFEMEELGMRTRDPGGVRGAALDATRISKDIGSWRGRVGSMFSKAAMMYAKMPEQLQSKWLMKQLTREFKETKGIDAVLPDGKRITSDMMDKETLDLYGQLVDPTATSKEIVKRLMNYVNDSDEAFKIINKTGSDAVKQAIKKYQAEYLDLDTFRVEALGQTSLAGQVSDMSETITRNFDNVAIENMMDDVLDRLETLMIMKNAADWKANSWMRDQNVWKSIAKRTNGAEEASTLLKRKEQASEEAYKDITKKAFRVTNGIREIAMERPQYIKPLFEFMEATDGNVNTMSAMMNELDNSLGSWTKAFKDGSPEIPQLVLQRLAGTAFNTILSGFKTVGNVFIGNLGGLLDFQVNTAVGSMFIGKEGKAVMNANRAALSGMLDTGSKTMEHTANQAWKIFNDKDFADKAMRPDLYMESERKLEALESLVDAAAADGFEGPRMAFNQMKTLEDLQRSNVFRFVPNLMATADAASSAFIASNTAKMKAFEKFYADYGGVGKAVPTTEFAKKKMSEISNDIYKEMFDANGLLRQGTEASYLQRQMALSADSPMAKALDGFVKQFPIARSVFWFPKIYGNIGQTLVNYTPINAFADEVGSYFKPLSTLTLDDMTQSLAKRGMTDLGPDEVMGTFMRERARVRGRMAVGTTLVSTVALMSLAGKWNGKGNRNPEIQRARGKEWVADAVQLPNGKWVSYADLGPIGDIISLVPTAIDNFTELRTGALEDLFGKVSFTIASMFDNADLTAGIKPLLDFAAGKGDTAMSRYLAANVNMGIPLATQRREWGKLLDSTQRNYERDMQGYLRNQNTFLEVFAPSAKLPYAIDSITGKPLGQEQNPLMRSFNTYSPFKVSDGPSKERQFLIDVEWGGRDLVNKSSNGTPLDSTEQSELWSIIAKQGYWRRDLQWLMEKAKDQKYIQNLRKLRRSNVTSSQLKTEDFQHLHALINQSLRSAIQSAEVELSTYDRLLTAEQANNLNDYEARTGGSQFYEEVNGVLQLTQP